MRYRSKANLSAKIKTLRNLRIGRKLEAAENAKKLLEIRQLAKKLPSKLIVESLTLE